MLIANCLSYTMLQFSLQKKLHAAEGEMQLDINCEINNGELICLHGHSGAGKTSILRMLAGFMKPDVGYIKINGEDWFDDKKRIDLTPQHRKIGFVFQDYALFPNMSIRENIAFPLAKNEPKDIVDELLTLTGLTNLANRKIQTLSGGQQQRVALARAIAKKPQILLLDEPLSAIDNTMRQQLQETLLQLHKRYQLTTILVSHDMDEILKLSDKIFHLEKGSIKIYDLTKTFLNDIGNLSGLVGNILSVEKKTDGNNIAVFIRNRVITIPRTENLGELKKGDKIEIIYNEDSIPLIKKSE